MKIGTCTTKNNDWYFSRNTDKGNTKPTFDIVHKRHWHYHHTVSDQHITRFLNLPEGFYEVNESQFEYNQRGVNRARELLISSGLTEIKKPIWWGQAHLFYSPTLEVTRGLDFMCDTPEIKELTQEWIKMELPSNLQELPKDWKKKDCLTKVESFANANNLAYVVTSDHREQEGNRRVWYGSNISLMKLEILCNYKFPIIKNL